MRKIKQFFWKLKRAFNWFKFIFKQDYISDYEIQISIMNKAFNELADKLEEENITTSSKQDARDIRKALKLIKNGVEEKYSTEFYSRTGGNVWEDWKVEIDKDQRSIDLGFKLMSHKIRGWWS